MLKTTIMFFAFLLFGAHGLAEAAPKGRVLIVVSNMEDMGDPEKHDARNNLWEYAPPYHVFYSLGYEVDFVSPKGGEVHFMMDPLGISSYTIKYENFLGKANNSLKPENIDPSQYLAVFIGGGYGTLFDVASNEEVLSIIASVYESGGVVGGSGHGPGAFANVKLSSGEFMVKGKRVAGFPNSTERSQIWAKQGTLLPFLVEDQLRKNGAITINKENISDKNDVILDQRIVSTMFLPSAAIAAREMINLMENATPKKGNNRDMDKIEHFRPQAFIDNNLPFSAAVRVGDMLYLSGQIGNLPGSKDLAPGGIEAETRQTMENIKMTIEKYGSAMDQVIKCTIFMADMAEWDAMNAVYVTFFADDRLPARSALGASGLALDSRVEIECIAVIK